MRSALELLDRALDSLLETPTSSVRDSDVKRKLLEVDPHFDEGELGFSKFSKFLQAAEEQGAVALTRGPNGNYHVSRRKGKKPDARPKAEPEKPSEAAAGTMQRLARFFFGSGAEEPEKPKEPAKAKEPEKAKASERPKKPAEGPREARARRGEPARRAPSGPPKGKKGGRPPRGAGERPAEPEQRRGQRGGARAARAEGPGVGSGERAPRGRRGEPRAETDRREAERRPRPGRREEAAAPQTTPLVKSETPMPPVVEERSSVEEAAAPASLLREERGEDVGAVSTPKAGREAEVAKAEAPPAVSPAAQPGAPRGTIRGRWGSRGRYRPSQAPPPIFEGQKSKKQQTERPGRPESASETGASVEPDAGSQAIMSRLRGYSGVGERTAETLVEAFGSDLFRVLDEEPDRVREVLSDRRAEQVLEARRREVETQRE
jgi:hypothetical protein